MWPYQSTFQNLLGFKHFIKLCCPICMHSSLSFDLRCSDWLENKGRKRQRILNPKLVHQLDNSPDFHSCSGLISESVSNAVSGFCCSNSVLSPHGAALKYSYSDSSFGALTSSSSTTTPLSPLSVGFPASLSTAHRISYSVATSSCMPELHHLPNASSMVNPPRYVDFSSCARITKSQTRSYSGTSKEHSPCRDHTKKISFVPSRNSGAQSSLDIRQRQGRLAASVEPHPQQKNFSTDSERYSVDRNCRVFHRQTPMLQVSRKPGTPISASCVSSTRSKRIDTSPPSRANPRQTTELRTQQAKLVTHRNQGALIANRNTGHGVSRKEHFTTAKTTDTEGGEARDSELFLHSSTKAGTSLRGSLMSGTTIAQKWKHVVNRQKSVDRRLSLASTSASTPSLHDRTTDWSIVGPKLDSSNCAILSPSWDIASVEKVKKSGGVRLASCDMVSNQPSHQRHKIGTSQHHCDHLTGLIVVASDPFSCNGHRCSNIPTDDKPRNTSNKEKSPSTRPQGTCSAQYSLEVLQPVDCGREKHVQSHYKIWDDKEVSLVKRPNKVDYVNNSEISASKQSVENRVGQRGCSRLIGNIVNRSIANLTETSTKKIHKGTTKCKNANSEIEALTVPAPLGHQHISSYSSYHCYDKEHGHPGGATSATLHCFIKAKQEDGTEYEIWACRNRGDFKPFLESHNFEHRLSRNFLRLANIPAHDRLADAIAYKTLRMLRSCRYAPSDILQCVALALCHIRRAAARISVRNSTEAAYVLCLQVQHTCSVIVVFTCYSL